MYKTLKIIYWLIRLQIYLCTFMWRPSYFRLSPTLRSPQVVMFPTCLPNKSLPAHLTSSSAVEPVCMLDMCIWFSVHAFNILLIKINVIHLNLLCICTQGWKILWAVNYTGTKSFITTFSNSLAKNFGFLLTEYTEVVILSYHNLWDVKQSINCCNLS